MKNLNQSKNVYFGKDIVTFLHFNTETETHIGVHIGSAFLVVLKSELKNIPS